MSTRNSGKRKKRKCDNLGYSSLLKIARDLFASDLYLEAFDVYEQLLDCYTDESFELLTEIYNCFHRLPSKDRYNFYQSRFFDFGIKDSDKVLDIGSGHIPFPLATHFGELTINNNDFGRAGVPFKRVETKPIIQCNVEVLPFIDKAFEFVYCSHVLEHVQNPEEACQEIIRVGKRGFIECPTSGKDLFFNTAKISNHHWAVEIFNDILTFREYNIKEIEGFNCDALAKMSLSPMSQREESIFALIHLKADKVNTMMLWEDTFKYEIRRLSSSNISVGKRLTSHSIRVSGLSDKNKIINDKDDVKISFIIIVLNGMPFIEFALKAIYEFAHEIIIVEGAVEKCMFAANPDGSSLDGTVELIRAFPDPDGKIRLIQGKWQEKIHMQNKALEYVNGDYVWLVDSDEIYGRRDIRKVIEILRDDQLITQINFIPDNFWKGFDYIFLSQMFFEKNAHYRRVFKYVRGAKFTSHRPPTMVHPGSDLTTEQMHLISGHETREMGIIPFHYSYILDEQVKQKIDLYNRYGWGEKWGIDLQEWYNEAFLKWTPDSSDAIEKKFPVWTGDRNSYTQQFNGTHPEVMSEFINNFRRLSDQYGGISDEKILPVIGSSYYQQKVLDAWRFIELDEPLVRRSEIIREKVRMGKPFWNIHVALAFIADRLQPKSYLEIGVRTGGSLVQVLNNSDVENVVAMDLWKGQYGSLLNTKKYAMQQICDFQAKSGKSFEIEFVQGNSHSELKELIKSGRKFDIITVDGDHSKDGAWEDLEDCIHLLNDRGALVFDDIIHPSHNYLMDLVHRLWENHPFLEIVLNTKQDNGCAIFFKCVNTKSLILENHRDAKTNKLKIAGDCSLTGNLTKIDVESDFAEHIRELFDKIHPKKLIETGTYMGTGTTAIIASSLREQGIKDAEFYTIEINPDYHRQAIENIERNNYSNVVALNGVSVPRSLLPSLQEIEDMTINNVEFDDIYVDHKEHERAKLYFEETEFADVPDDLIGKCLERFDHCPDFVLLDSAGHLGNIEFNYLISLLKGECYIALDNIYHIKHHRSFLQITEDPRFELIHASNEKFGFCLARFTPRKYAIGDSGENIIWLRTDAIGDNVLASSMLEHIREKYDGARITVFCQDRVGELYEACPYVDDIIRYDRSRALNDEKYRNYLVRRLRRLNADLLLNSVYSRDSLSDFLALNSGAEEIIAHEGDNCNIDEGHRLKNNRAYTRLVSNNGGYKLELERNRDFLEALGVNVGTLEPKVWLSHEDEKSVDELFRSNNLKPGKTMALFSGAQRDVRLYDRYGIALARICKDNQFAVIGLGAEKEWNINQENLDAIGNVTINLSGKTSLRQTAALLKRCRLAVGAETGLAHIACAVGVPSVILLGGGHFGRFLPYSPLTSVICLPLDCFNCNWKCRYSAPYCVHEVSQKSLTEAIRQTLLHKSEKPRVFVQGASTWKSGFDVPLWKMFDGLLNADDVEIIHLDDISVSSSVESSAEEEAVALSRKGEKGGINLNIASDSLHLLSGVRVSASNTDRS